VNTLILELENQMLKFLQRLFKGKHPLRLAAELGDAARFGRALIESKVVVIHADLGERLPLNASEREVLKIVETAAASVPTAARFFSYLHEGKTYFPFFLSQSDAEIFCGAYSGRENALFAYQVLEVQGAAIAERSREADKLVMNDQCDDEFTPSSEWISTLQALLSSNTSDIGMKRLSVCIPHPSLRG
jgi:hypothetical protein